MPENFIAWAWWIFTAIIVAILVNLASAYIKPLVDKAWSFIITRRRQTSEKRQGIFEAKIDYLLDNPEMIINSRVALNQLSSRLNTLGSTGVIISAVVLLELTSRDKLAITPIRPYVVFFLTLMLAMIVFSVIRTKGSITENIQIAYEFEDRMRERDPAYRLPPF